MTTYILGIEWESSSLRLAIARRANSGKLTLLRVDTLAFASEDATHRQTIFKNWLTTHIPHNAPVGAVLAIPESHIILKELELPFLKGQELAEAIHWELTGKSSLGAQSSTSWKIVEKQDEMLRVVAMSIKKSEIAQAVSFFAEAGVELLAIEPSSLSSGRFLEFPHTTNVILTLSGAEVSAVFVRGGVPVFSTSFAIPLTESAVRARHLSRDAAASLSSQLKKIIAYWNAKEAHVISIIVTGEAAAFTGLKSDVARGLPVPLVLGQMKKGAAAVAKSVSPGVALQYAASVGAALRGGKIDADTLNFLPKENLANLQKKARGSFARALLWKFVTANVFILVLLAALSGFLWIRRLAYAANIAQTKRFVDNHPAQKFVAHISSVNALAQEISTLMARQENVGARLKYLASVTPAKIRFDSLKMVSGTKEEWEITGVADRPDILAFYYKLKADQLVREVTMPYTNFNRETDSPFTLTIVW